MLKGDAAKKDLQEFIEELKKFEQEMPDMLTAFDKKQISYIVEELENPKPAPKGMYKIPHELLCDSLRKQRDTEDITSLTNCIYEYSQVDGKLPQQVGEKFAEAYSNPEVYTYTHAINYRGHIHSNEELHDLTKSICKDGLRLTTMGNEVGKLDYTTNSSKEGFVSLASKLQDASNVIVLQIPKEKVDTNFPIIGSKESDELSPENPGYVLPQYVEAYIANDEYVENPYPKNKLTAYPYHASENLPSQNSKSENEFTY